MQNSLSLLPNAERARTITLVFYLILGLCALELLVVGREVLIYLDMQKDIYLDVDAIEIHNTIRGLLAIARLVLLIIAAVFFVRWMVWAHHNYQAAGGQTIYTKSNVQWAFFIPFVNLAKPYRIVQEFWHGMFDKVRGRGATKSQLQQTVVGWWWGIWLTGNILGNISARTSGTGEDVSLALFSNYLEIASTLLEIPAALLAIFIIQGFTQLEAEYEAYVQIEELSEPNEDGTQSDFPAT